MVSEDSAPGQGVEVALLSCNIKIQAEEGSADTDGGYLQIFHTPGVAQVIEGAEFTNMGQRGGKNRFPIQFLYSGDVNGTSIARNSIRDSNHRCIVLEGTSNAVVDANVAHDTAGHCYFVGYQAMGNTISNNLGSRTNDNIRRLGGQLAGENDQDMHTFHVWNSQNDFIGNVAAGSDDTG